MSNLISDLGTLHPKDDPRSVNELFLVALCESDEDRVWYAKIALQWRATREVLDRALELCKSFCAFERGLGADILGQLGVPKRSFPEECLRMLLDMLEREQHSDVLRAILVALSHLGQPESVLPALRFRHHVDSDIRYSVVFALSGHTMPEAIAGLIELTNDPVCQVRDWATFGLGTLVDVDTPDVRKALWERLSDHDDDTRCEALVGLARRNDRRVIPALSSELRSGFVEALAVEAAEHIGDPQLLADLIALRERWGPDCDSLENAITACSRERPIAIKECV
jgi:HEAT repeat protein